MNTVVRKAVFPVAGLGTRFLPATKANPKEMLPIVDKPLIQYAAEEAVAAGIEQLIFVTGRTKRAIEDHFDKAYELENELAKAEKTRMLEIVRNVLPPHVECIYIRQAEPLGLGHAVLCARPVIGDEPFAVLLADDLIYSAKQSCLQQMVEIHRARGAAGVIAVEEVAPADTGRYGIVALDTQNAEVGRIRQIVEKPAPADAPSNLAVVGRYVLPGSIMDVLAKTRRGAGGEIQLTDAIASLLHREEMLAYRFHGKRFDCGSKLGYLQATVEYAMQHPELGPAFRGYLQSLC